MGKYRDHDRVPNTNAHRTHRTRPPLRQRRPSPTPGVPEPISKTLRNSTLSNQEILNVESCIYKRCQELEKLKGQLESSEEKFGDQSLLLKAGKALISKKDSENQDLLTTNAALDGRVKELESDIGSLHAEIAKIGRSSPDQAVAIANEISAARTLNLVQGLRKEVADREEEVRRERAQVKRLAGEVTRFEGLVEEERRRKVEAEGIAVEQQGLIERLMQGR